MVAFGAGALVMALAVVVGAGLFFRGTALRDAAAQARGPRDSTELAEGALRSSAGSLFRRPGVEIQRRIDAAIEGEVIEVEPGIYQGPIDFRGKAISLRSRDGAERTIIEGPARGGPAVIIRGQPSSRGAQLTGFTIRSGRGPNGTGVFVERADPLIARCVISGNSASGLRLEESRAVIDECRFLGNSAGPFGGAVQSRGGAPIFVSCGFEGNVAVTGGGALFFDGGAPAVLVSRFSGNRVSSGAWGGAIFADAAEVVILDTEFTGNRSGEQGGAIYVRRGSVKAEHCLFEGNASRSAWAFLAHDATVSVRSSRFCGTREWNLQGSGIVESHNEFATDCMRDCNGNQIPDDLEIAEGLVTDCDQSGVPDACKPDCDGDGIPDACAISMGLSRDENRNGIPDECEDLGDAGFGVGSAGASPWTHEFRRGVRPMQNPPARTGGFRD
ncbi:MAG: right-handed parallel beta-helix repeat-containing protein [Phycisphaeraceae bacterium]|nr:right-handed parallel beta-helix repeat-containing protein [Phycisphaeraceae bacterium]